MSTAQTLQNIIDEAWLNGDPATVTLSGDYVIDEPILFRSPTGTTSANTWGWRLIGNPYATVTANFAEADRYKPMFDFTGTARGTIENIHFIGGPESNPSGVKTPGCAILMARETDGASAGFHLVNNCKFTGRFKISCVCCIASEGNWFKHCHFSNNEGPYTTFNTVPIGGHHLLFSCSNPIPFPCDSPPCDWEDEDIPEDGLVDAEIGANTMLTYWADSCTFEKRVIQSGDEGGMSVHFISHNAATISDYHFSNCRSISENQFAWAVINVLTTGINGVPAGSGGGCQMFSFTNSVFDEHTSTYGIYAENVLPRAIANVSVKSCIWNVGDRLFDFGEYIRYLEIHNVNATKNSSNVVSGGAVTGDNLVDYEPLGLITSGWS